MASTLFVQMESRMRRRAMIDLMEDLQIEARRRAGVQFVEVPAVQVPNSAMPQLLPHAVLPIVPGRLMRVGRPVCQSGWPESGSGVN
jgi:hypothetical protein